MFLFGITSLSMLKIKHIGLIVTGICCLAMVANALIFGKQDFPGANLHMAFFIGALLGSCITLVSPNSR